MSRTLSSRFLLCVFTLSTLLAAAALGQPPPPPPEDTGKLPTAKRRKQPRIIRLEPGQDRITPEILEKAPTPAEKAAQEAKQREDHGTPSTPRPVAKVPQPPPSAISRLKPEEKYLGVRYPQLFGAVSAPEILIHLRKLGADRGAGSTGEAAAADYIRTELEDTVGMSAREERFTTPQGEGRNLWARIDGWDPLDFTDGAARLAAQLQITEAQRPGFFHLVMNTYGPRPVLEPARRVEAEKAILEQLTPEQRTRWEELRPVREQVVVLHAPYSEQGPYTGASASALLALAKLLKQYPPRRTVWLLATPGEEGGELGLREYLRDHLDELQPMGPLERASASVGGRLPWLLDLWAPVRWVLVVALSGLAIWALVRTFRRRSAGAAVGVIITASCVVLLLLTVRFTPAREPVQIQLFTSLDLLTHSRTLTAGTDLAPLGDVTVENAKRVAAVTMHPAVSVFTSSEAGTSAAGLWRKAGGHTLSFSTQGTVAGKVSPETGAENVAVQTRTLACLLDHILNDPKGLGALHVPLGNPPPLRKPEP